MTTRLPSLADFEALVPQLEADPMAIGNPDVLEQLRWLKAFANFEDLPQTQLEELLATEEGVAYFNAMMNGGARKTLRNALDAFVRRMLPTIGTHAGFTIQPVKLRKRRGRKSPPSRPWEQSRLLQTFCWMRSRLERLEQQHPLVWKPRRAETYEAHMERVALDVVQGVHADSWLRKLHPAVERRVSEFGIDADGMIVGLIHPADRPVLTVPLPPDVARRIASQALQKRADTNALLYGLLAFYESKTPGQVRGVIEKARAERPDAFENCLAALRAEP